MYAERNKCETGVREQFLFDVCTLLQDFYADTTVT